MGTLTIWAILQFMCIAIGIGYLMNAAYRQLDVLEDIRDLLKERTED